MPKQEKITLNKYGKLRLKYLKENKKADYTIMLMDGTLNIHLKEWQETADNRVQQIIRELKAKSNLTEDMKNTVMLVKSNIKWYNRNILNNLEGSIFYEAEKNSNYSILCYSDSNKHYYLAQNYNRNVNAKSTNTI